MCRISSKGRSGHVPHSFTITYKSLRANTIVQAAWNIDKSSYPTFYFNEDPHWIIGSWCYCAADSKSDQHHSTTIYTIIAAAAGRHRHIASRKRHMFIVFVKENYLFNNIMHKSTVGIVLWWLKPIENVYYILVI